MKFSSIQCVPEGGVTSILSVDVGVQWRQWETVFSFPQAAVLKEIIVAHQTL